VLLIDDLDLHADDPVVLEQEEQGEAAIGIEPDRAVQKHSAVVLRLHAIENDRRLFECLWIFLHMTRAAQCF